MNNALIVIDKSMSNLKNKLGDCVCFSLSSDVQSFYVFLHCIRNLMVFHYSFNDVSYKESANYVYINDLYNELTKRLNINLIDFDLFISKALSNNRYKHNFYCEHDSFSIEQRIIYFNKLYALVFNNYDNPCIDVLTCYTNDFNKFIIDGELSINDKRDLFLRALNTELLGGFDV